MPPKTKRNSTSKRVGKAPVSGASRAELVFAPSRCTRALRRGRYADRIGGSAGVFMAGVLEYLVAEVLDLADVESKLMRNKSIQPKHINLAFRKDQELGQLMHHATFTTSSVLVETHPFHLKGKAAKDHEASQ